MPAVLVVHRTRASDRVWSWPFIKWWYGQLLFRTAHGIVGALFEDSIFMVHWLRLLGARLGSGVKKLKMSISDGSCLELLDAAGSCLELPGDAWSCLELP